MEPRPNTRHHDGPGVRASQPVFAGNSRGILARNPYLIFAPLPDRLNAAWEGVEGRSSGRCCGDGPFVLAFE